MSAPIFGLIGLVIMVFLFLLRMPISFSMLISGVIGIALMVNPVAGLGLLGLDFFSQASSYVITVIPMFVLAGSIAFEAGIGNRILKFAMAIGGRLPGSLCIATTIACAGFGAICGSSAATAAALGRVALPVMKEYNYNLSMAAGSIAVGGTLAVMIPPSTIFMVYGILTQESIGKLFIAGILPGILLTVLLSITVMIMCLRNPMLAPLGPKITTKDKLEGLTGIAEVLVLFLLVIGGLFAGWFSPTQGGAILAVGVAIVAIVRRSIKGQGFIAALRDSTKISGMVIFIMIAALIFSRFINQARIPVVVQDILLSIDNKWLVYAVIMIVYMIGGCFMDGMALITILLPIIYPTILALGFDPIWFGVVLCANGELGMITPPFGINVFVVRGLDKDLTLEMVFKGIAPFVITDIIFLIILSVFPEISLVLPRIMTY
jgi:C4-dicarboxylate transporter, DctM subunit